MGTTGVRTRCVIRSPELELFDKLQRHTIPSFHNKERKIYSYRSQRQVRGESRCVEEKTKTKTGLQPWQLCSAGVQLWHGKAGTLKGSANRQCLKASVTGFVVVLR